MACCTNAQTTFQQNWQLSLIGISATRCNVQYVFALSQPHTYYVPIIKVEEFDAVAVMRLKLKKL